jgi:hypothetical protein
MEEVVCKTESLGWAGIWHNSSENFDAVAHTSSLDVTKGYTDNRCKT